MGLAIEKKIVPDSEIILEANIAQNPRPDQLHLDRIWTARNFSFWVKSSWWMLEILHHLKYFFFSSTLPHSNSQENCLLSLIYRNTFRVILNFEPKKWSKMPNWNLVKLLTFCLHLNFHMQFDKFFSMILFCFEFTRFLIWLATKIWEIEWLAGLESLWFFFCTKWLFFYFPFRILLSFLLER